MFCSIKWYTIIFFRCFSFLLNSWSVLSSSHVFPFFTFWEDSVFTVVFFAVPLFWTAFPGPCPILSPWHFGWNIIILLEWSMRVETSFWLAFKMILTLSSKTNTDFHGEAPIRNQYNIHINLTNVPSVFLHHQANDLFSVKFKGLGVSRPPKGRIFAV